MAHRTILRRIAQSSAIIAIIATLLAFRGAPAHADLAHDQADHVWGQATLPNNCSATPSASSLCGPRAAVIDTHENLWVADNNRVLLFPDDPSTGHPSMTATKVFGQFGSFSTGGCNQAPPGQPSWMGVTTAHTLCRVGSIAVDQAGTLYVADTGNNRVLIFRHAADAPADPPADLVLGQPSVTTFSANDTTAGGTSLVQCGSPAPASACTLNQPAGVSVDAAGDVLVADSWNNRVLLWSAATLAPVMATGCQSACVIPASRVWGQNGSFATNSTNGTGSSACGLTPPTATSLACPQYALVDGAGTLFIADSWNNRILAFDHALTQDVETPSSVYGQNGSFTSGAQDLGGASAASLSDPSGMAFDSTGNLWVADTGNSRVLRYPYSPSTGQRAATADWVVGTGGMFEGVGLCTTPSTQITGLCTPSMVAFDAAGTLYIADPTSNRVLAYTGAAPPLTAGSPPSGSPSAATTTPMPTPTATVLPALTATPTPQRTHACRTGYRRVQGTCTRIGTKRRHVDFAIKVWVSPSVLRYGEAATLYAKTRSGAGCAARVVYSTGRRPVSFSGYAQRVSKSGMVHWWWHEETRGTWGSASVTCEWRGTVKSSVARFQVTH